MKKSELRQIIRECYTEVVKENQNPFFDATIDEAGKNPFFDATIDEMKIKQLKDRDLEAVSGYLKNFYSDLHSALERIGEKSYFENNMQDLRKIPLFREAEQKDYLTFTAITPRGEKYNSKTGTYDGTGGTETSSPKDEMDYQKWQNQWDELKKNHEQKPGWSSRVENAIQELLKIARKNNGRLMQTNDIKVRIKSTDGQDSLDVSIVKKPENNWLRKLFTFKQYSDKPNEITFKYGKGVFKDYETMNLQKFGLSILKSVQRQKGQVGGIYYDQSSYDNDMNAEYDADVVKSKTFKKGITPK